MRKISQMHRNTSSTIEDEDSILIDNDNCTEEYADTRDGENITENNENISRKCKC